MIESGHCARVIQQFEELIDLRELILHIGFDASVAGLDADLLQKRIG